MARKMTELEVKNRIVGSLNNVSNEIRQLMDKIPLREQMRNSDAQNFKSGLGSVQEIIAKEIERVEMTFL